jgi:hypothetical protein
VLGFVNLIGALAMWRALIGEKEKGRHERDRGGVGAIARVSRDANEKTPFVSSSPKKKRKEN